MKRLQEEEVRMSMAVVFQIYGRPLEAVTAFKSLGWVIKASADDWPVVVANTRTAWRRWPRISRILGWEVVDPRTSGTFYKVVVHDTLLFGVEKWDTTNRISRTLGGFHHRVAFWMTRMRPRQDTAGR